MKIRRQSTFIARITICLAVAVLAGCKSTQPTQRIDKARAAYQQGNYPAAYEQSVQLTAGSGRVAEEAAYVAGMSAYHMNNFSAAEPYLLRASKSTDRSLSGDAFSTLGLMYSRQERYDRASEALTGAAERVAGEDRANAYFYAAVAQQKLGWWPQARATLMLARASSKNAEFLRRVDEYLATTGFTLQLGAFADLARAQQHAKQFAPRTQSLRLGDPRVVQGVDESGNTIYRVHVGRFTSYASAAGIRSQLGTGDCIIVPLGNKQ